ncbi:MAG: hypothetical protein ACYS1A_17095 [Planctomycetota bacterium]
MKIAYGWPINQGLIDKGIATTGDPYSRWLLQRNLDTESEMSKSTAGAIQPLDATMIVYAETDKKAYDELANWHGTIWYTNEAGRYGKPAVSYKDLGVAPNIIRIRDWHPVGGFAPDPVPAGKLFAFAQNVIIEVDQD